MHLSTQHIPSLVIVLSCFATPLRASHLQDGILTTTVAAALLYGTQKDHKVADKPHDKTVTFHHNGTMSILGGVDGELAFLDDNPLATHHTEADTSNPNDKQPPAQAFLHTAKTGDATASQRLGKKSIDPLAQDEAGYNVLHYAAMGDQQGTKIAWLIDKVKIPVDIQGHGQRTPFLCAVLFGNLQGLQVLHAKGANVHAKDHHGRNALDLAWGQPVIDFLKNTCNL